MPVDHFGELLVRLQALPFECGAPVLEEATSPALPLVVPELPKLLLEDVGRAQSLVGLEQQLQTPAPIRRQVLPMRQQRVLLALDEAPARARQPGILGLAHRIQGCTQVTQHVELVEQNGCVWRMFRLERGDAKRLPHVHHRQPDAVALRRTQPLVELVHARFRAVVATEPDRPSSFQVADHDAVGVPLADRDLVDPDHLRRRRPRPSHLLAHILRIEVFDRLPVQPGFLGDILDRHAPAAPSHEEGEALGVEWVGRQPLQLLLLHRAAPRAVDTANLQIQIDPCVPAGQVANSAYLAVVPGPRNLTADAAGRFFPRRHREMTRAFGSPKMPRTVGLGRKPGKR